MTGGGVERGRGREKEEERERGGVINYQFLKPRVKGVKGGFGLSKLGLW